MHSERVAAEQSLHIAGANQSRKMDIAARMNDHRPGNDNHLLAGVTGALYQGGGLLDCCFDLALGGDAVAHEGERKPVALLRLGNNADAAHTDYDLIAGFDVAQFPAPSLSIANDD